VPAGVLVLREGVKKRSRRGGSLPSPLGVGEVPGEQGYKVGARA
jgi:hypothetical protein